MNAIETENIVAPSYPHAIAKDDSNIFQDNSVNKALPYFAIAIIIAMFGASMGVYALREASLMERETRIMKDDLKYIRAYLSARGIEVPANHEAAEDR